MLRTLKPKDEKQSVQRMARLLWMNNFAREHGSMHFEAVRAALGLSLRTYRRYLAVLREAGVRLEGTHGTQGRDPVGLVTYLGFDEILAPIVGVPERSRAAKLA